MRSRAPTKEKTLAPPVHGGVGSSARRQDAVPKVKGEFAYSSDLWAEGMLWGATVRSPHPRAAIRSLDITDALLVSGVHSVLTHEDVPGRKLYGMEIVDQPVLAENEIRYEGEAIALVAADHPEIARRAAAQVRVDYEELEPLVDPEVAISSDAPKLHSAGNVIRHARIRVGDPDATADIVVKGVYETAMQDQAFLGPESGLAVPSEDGGIDLYVATQWLHVDLDQLAASLGLPRDKVRITLAGVGGAFGAREDLSMQIHCCMLALHTGRPVKMMYSREESFYGHVHRHPARMHYEHGATSSGELVYIKARIVLDGGAYASSSTAVCGNATAFACGPYEVPNVEVDGLAVYTNNPPCGAMRGFGAVQACFAYESQMDKLAAALGMDPVELRTKNAMSTGSTMPTGQIVEGPAPVAELLKRVREMPVPPQDGIGPPDLRALPGGVSNTTHGEGIKRGTGYAIGIKNIAFSEGFDDYATAAVRLFAGGGEAQVEVQSAAAEVGQGVGIIQMQIARTELGVERVTLMPADTTIGSAGSSSASRQTWMTGGAVKSACEAVRRRLIERAAEELNESPSDLELERDTIVSTTGAIQVPIADLLGTDSIEETSVFRHRKTYPMDPDTGQGDAHVAFAFAAHRAIVDVDTELGLVRVVELATAQDVGKAINPQSVEGQIEGGSAQGLGLALMEEIQVSEGKIRNPSFTDYLIPTVLDMPPMKIDVLELGDPEAPYGLKGVGEPPTISSTPAVIAALRDATGRALGRAPVRPEDLVGLSEAEKQ